MEGVIVGKSAGAEGIAQGALAAEAVVGVGEIRGVVAVVYF